MSGVPAARADIASLKSYSAGAQIDDTIRLNANEAPVSAGGTGLNRYPEIHPLILRNGLASLFDIPADNLLVTRGTSEAIDILIRAWCRAYCDTVITTPPTFDMYRLYADIQGVEITEVPLCASDFSFDVPAILSASRSKPKLIFLCSPNNPTGSLISEIDLTKIVKATTGQSIVVLDESYVEFADRASLSRRVLEHQNLVVLRTLSKAHGLAGARCGAVIACGPIIDMMAKVLPPYSFPTPAIDAVLKVLSSERLKESAATVANIIAERTRVSDLLGEFDCTNMCWPSQANFILVRFNNLQEILKHLLQRKILVRDIGKNLGLKNCARITIGSKEENDSLLNALDDFMGRD